MSAPNQGPPSRQQSQDEDLAFHPDIWQNPISPPGLDNASVASSASHNHGGNRNASLTSSSEVHRSGHRDASVASSSSQHLGDRNQSMGYNVQPQHNALPARPPMSNMLPARPAVNMNNTTGSHFGATNAATLRPPPGFAGHHQGFTGQHQGTAGFTGQYQDAVGFTGQNQDTFGFTSQRQDAFGFTGQRPGVNSFAQQPSQQGYVGMGGSQQQPMNNFGQPNPHQTQFGGQTPRAVQSFVQTPQQGSEMYQPRGNNASRPQRDVSRTAYPPARTGEGQGGVQLYDPNFNFSDNYRGSREANSNRSANVPEDENCAVFIRGLPPTCTPNMLLREIRGCGTKVWALFINAPDARNPNHCAAKLVFFQRCGVDWLFAQIRAGLFVVTDENGGQYHPNAVYNNIRSAPQAATDRRSRVLVIAGPPSLVTASNLDALFKADFFFEADTAFVTSQQQNWRVMEFHFSSTRCQSENGIQVLQRVLNNGPGTFAP